MADNVTANSGTGGATFAADDIGGVHYPRFKLGLGADGAATDAVGGSGTNSAAVLRVTVATDDALVVAAQLLDDCVYIDDADWTDNTSKHLLVGGVYQATPHTVTDGDVTPFLTDANGRLIVAATDNGGSITVDNAGTFAVQAAQSGTWNITNISGTVSLPTGAATAANQSTANTALDAIKTAVEILDNTVSGSEMQVDVVAALPAGTNNIGDVDVLSLPATPAGTNLIGRVKPEGDEYETVAASQTDQALGATGATGDYLAGVLIVPATTSPGAVSIKDGGGSAITIFTGGASSVSNLVPFLVPLGIVSGAGAWQVTTGANVSAIGIGNFT